MSRRPTRPPSRSLSAATTRAFRSLGCTGESALDVLAEASQAQPRLHTGASSTGSRDDAPPAAPSRPGDADSAAPEPSVEHPAPLAGVPGPPPPSSEAHRSPSPEMQGDSPPPTSPPGATPPLRRQLPRLRHRWQLAGRRSGQWLPEQWSLHL
ncbi:hypothetical protein PR003_g14589 [Phytophthora rubi]|uniref:Uncharacterized protein n=1 Tax=Phytophthora rubi TaxID=129364 RepID=A0A6A4F2B6_9STRA|nr:hypothetical protein PR003_g14589 [Phytophthora rubi]